MRLQITFLVVIVFGYSLILGDEGTGQSNSTTIDPTTTPPESLTTASPESSTTAPPESPTTAPPESPTTAPPESPTTAPSEGPLNSRTTSYSTTTSEVPPLNVTGSPPSSSLLNADPRAAENLTFEATTSKTTNVASSSPHSSTPPESPITTPPENSTTDPLESPTTTPPDGPLNPQNNETNNETTSYNTTTSEVPLLNVTGSPPSSSFLNADPKGQNRIDDGQRFDAASFIGGIILAIGVVALGIFLFKVYQSRKGPRAEYNNI